MIHALFVGIPLAIVVVLAAMIWSRKGPHAPTYKMSEQWTHEPILWAAVGEPVGAPHGHGHGSDELKVGGGASGKW
ncbi:MAG: hypothetical protein QOH57_3436 [Mycobacterium sp.]|jgi:hypothetical protein|nr:hypothetical protein [Mycobacterium sp.]